MRGGVGEPDRVARRGSAVARDDEAMPRFVEEARARLIKEAGEYKIEQSRALYDELARE